ncbi:MAG TPA: pyridoxamine 5'-phosphate oxidase family protein [Vicinamibacterales bacterium]
MIPDELAAFLQSGISISLATRDAALMPSGARVWAVKVDEDRVHLTAYVRHDASARVLADLEHNGQAALCFGRPADHRTVQVKGTFVEARPADEGERAEIDRQVGGFLYELEGIGIPRAMFGKYVWWPATAIRIRVHELFNQTPGPGAGEPLR